MTNIRAHSLTVGLTTALLMAAMGSCQPSKTGPLDPVDGGDAQRNECSGGGDCRGQCDPLIGCDCSGANGRTAGDGCAVWEDNLGADNLASLQRFALSQAVSVVTGSFGVPQTLQDESYVPLTVGTVHYGWSFLTGLEVMVRVHPDLVERLPESPQWVVAFSQHHPNTWEHDERHVWGNAVVVVPQQEAAAFPEAMGYRTEPTSKVAVVRITGQDEYRTTFEVIDALQGTFPTTFCDNWYASWELPYPEVSGDDWIASVFGLTEYPDGVVLGSVYDFRPASPEQLSLVKDALADSTPLYDKEQLRAERDGLLAGIRFHHSPWIFSSVVSGLAGECCTGAGGTFVQHDVSEVLRGEAPPTRFVTGGHGYYGEEDCGDPFLHGLSAIVDPSDLMKSPFDCLEYPDMDSWDANAPQITSGVTVRTPNTAQNRAQVEGWLAASAPLYQLYPPDAEVPDEALKQDFQNAPWSHPIEAVKAFVMATHIVLLQVDEVAYNVQQGAHEVIFSTTFSTHEYDHLVRYSIKLAFRCGDPRLLEVGSRWIGGLVLVDPWMFNPDEQPILDRSFLIPGTLVPEEQMSGQLESDLAYYLN